MDAHQETEMARAVRDALPQGGLFDGKDWRVSPRGFPVSGAFAGELDKLGHRLEKFLRACDLLYRLSVDGRQPAWIAEVLDRGKPADLVALQRDRIFRNDLPRVIRPDLILTERGFAIAELDNVPGGIGLTGWLARAYASQGADVLGGLDGMLDGFASILPGGDILVSNEAATYRPEMEWLAAELNAKMTGPEAGAPHWRVLDCEPRDDWQARIYRFFELFDLANVPCAQALIDRARAGEVTVTPPFKPALEEKLWFALFWLRPLEGFWRRELGDRTLAALREAIPYTWLMDPTPLPPHAVLPRLEVNRWQEVGEFTQKQRELILKISGFNERAWGARGVVMAQDVPHIEWKQAVETALAEFDTQPHILQQFHKAKLVEHPYLDNETGRIESLKGRVRLCPYYFTSKNRPIRCSGALATLVPADKKLIHGMSDAILAPAMIER